MNVILDFGNTNVKIITKEKTIFLKNTKDDEIIEKLNHFFTLNKFSNVIIINVGINANLLRTLNCNYTLFNNNDLLKYVAFDLDITFFGVDRIANILAYKLQNSVEKNFIIFDFGTYLTIDVITNNKYDFGRITIGIRKQVEQICISSENMHITPKQIFEETNLNTTSGQIKLGLTEQYNALINYYVQQYKTHAIVVTGHDTVLIKANKNVIINEYLLKNLL